MIIFSLFDVKKQNMTLETSNFKVDEGLFVAY